MTDNVRYIGQSVDPFRRFYGHLASKNRTYCGNWIRKLTNLGLKPNLVFFEMVEDGDDWASVEKSWISLARDLEWPITNTCSGGEGIDSETMIEIWKNPIFREKLLYNRRLATSNPEYKIKHKKAMQEFRNRPKYNQFKEVLSKRSKTLWKDDKYRQSIISKRDTPDKLKLKSTYMKIRWKEDERFKECLRYRWNEEARNKQRQLILTDDRQQKIKESLTHDIIQKRNVSIKKQWIERRKKDILNNKSRGEVPFKGVSKTLGGTTYRSAIRIEGHTVNLGDYETPEEASWAYEIMAQGLYNYYCLLESVTNG